MLDLENRFHKFFLLKFLKTCLKHFLILLYNVLKNTEYLEINVLK